MKAISKISKSFFPNCSFHGVFLRHPEAQLATDLVVYPVVECHQSQLGFSTAQDNPQDKHHLEGLLLLSLVYSFVRSFTHSFDRLLIRLIVYSFVWSFTHSFDHSIVCLLHQSFCFSFIHWFVRPSLSPSLPLYLPLSLPPSLPPSLSPSLPPSLPPSVRPFICFFLTLFPIVHFESFKQAVF